MYLHQTHIYSVKAQTKKMVYCESSKLSTTCGRSEATCCHPNAFISIKHYIWLAFAEREKMDSMMSSSGRGPIHINLILVVEVKRHLCLWNGTSFE